mmetsp:Transcript_27815/g.91023  ORF Transcript_27815/g.91023 Transcript_27815/m.91023 type:complete len:106 (-) Transcript_27815:2736-3053(-)
MAAAAAAAVGSAVEVRVVCSTIRAVAAREAPAVPEALATEQNMGMGGNVAKTGQGLEAAAAARVLRVLALVRLPRVDTISRCLDAAAAMQQDLPGTRWPTVAAGA